MHQYVSIKMFLIYHHMNNYMIKHHTIALIPAYDEEVTIANVIQKTKQFADNILVINNSSIDTTKQSSIQVGIEVIDNIVNRGLGQTMNRGYEEALRHGAV